MTTRLQKNLQKNEFQMIIKRNGEIKFGSLRMMHNDAYRDVAARLVLAMEGIHSYVLDDDEMVTNEAEAAKVVRKLVNKLVNEEVKQLRDLQRQKEEEEAEIKDLLENTQDITQLIEEMKKQ